SRFHPVARAFKHVETFRLDILRVLLTGNPYEIGFVCGKIAGHFESIGTGLRFCLSVSTSDAEFLGYDTTILHHDIPDRVAEIARAVGIAAVFAGILYHPLPEH